MKYAQLGDLGEFRNGVNFKGDRMGRGFPLVNVKDITGSHRIEVDHLDLVEVEVKNDMFAREGDLFFVRSSVKLDGIALCAKVMPTDKKAIHCGFVIRYRPMSDEICTDYLLYLLRSWEYRERLKGLSGGTAIVNVSQGALKGLRIPIPSLHQQKRIGSILSAYDDLIENNRRRIQLLEQAARLLYKEWFVHLRFPGHEHIKIIDGLPEGWRKLRIGDLCTKIGSGATPRGGAASYQTAGISLIRSLNVYDYNFHDKGLVFINEQQADKLSNVTTESRDVLINITGASVARCCIVPDRHLPARVNQHVMILRPIQNKVCSEYLLCAINSERQKQLVLSIARAGGATREALTKDTVANIQIVTPSSHLMAVFREFALKKFVQIETLQRHNAALSKARDILLPRLMNGEIPV